MNRKQYIESYKSRNGSTKNSSKSYTRYSEGVIKQENQVKREAGFRARVLELKEARNKK